MKIQSLITLGCIAICILSSCSSDAPKAGYKLISIRPYQKPGFGGGLRITIRDGAEYETLIVKQSDSTLYKAMPSPDGYKLIKLSSSCFSELQKAITIYESSSREERIALEAEYQDCRYK